jgi:hypothetical protein
MPDVLPGDRMPFCYGMTADRQFYSFEAQAGRPAAVILANAACLDDLARMVGDFARRSDALARHNADVLVLGDEDVVRALPDRLPARCRIKVVDCGASFLAQCSVPRGATAVVLCGWRCACRRDSRWTPRQLAWRASMNCRARRRVRCRCRRLFCCCRICCRARYAGR